MSDLLKNSIVFNMENDGYKTGKYSLFLGQRQALYDSINKVYPQLFNFYKLQMQVRWTEDEVNLEQSRMDMLPSKSKPEEIDLMVKTLALLWELDSVASRSVIGLFAPFITNSELGSLMTEWSTMENIHALTYSEIIRQCISDPSKVFDEVLKNDEVLGRSDLIINVFDQLALAGAKYTLGLIKNGPELRRIILKGLMALYLLEKVQFMSSFAIIFGMAGTNRYLGIASLVQLICRDELLHAQFSETIINILKEDDDWNDDFHAIKGELVDLMNEVIKRELHWNNYIFSEGRTMVGLNKTLLDEWVYFCARELAESIDLPFNHPVINKVPITWMLDWIDMNKRQQAPQEEDMTNYRKNSVVADMDDDEIFDI